MKVKSILIVCFILTSIAFSDLRAQNSGAYYQITDIPGEITKKINLWGTVNRPGRYEVSLSTNLIQLITYAGGPKEFADMDEIRVYREKEDGTRFMLEINLEDPDETKQTDLDLYDEDTIVIEQSAIVSWREIFSTISGPLAIIASLAIILDRVKNF